MESKQTDLYDFMDGGRWGAKARTSDPATSVGAAEKMNRGGTTKKLCEAVLAYLRSVSPVGATSSEIARHLGIGRDSVSPRMKGMESSGRIWRNGERRDGQAVWSYREQ